ncbi:O-methyltransferase [Candidatus Kapabacteria bacterium]|nr:O-methyltransferase [Candidatus Kapabacteria bacterium]
MSAMPTVITPEIHQYLNERFSCEDPFLKKSREEAEKVGIPPIHINQEQGKFLQFYLKSINAKYVLEVGSLAGYSAITMARAIQDGGKVVCLEINPRNADFIREQASQSGLSDKIEVHTGDAQKFIKEYKPDFKFDFVFIDADKGGYSKYMNYSLPLLRVGGVICADNALAFGKIITDDSAEEKKNVAAIRKFNEEFIAKEELFTTLVTMGDGMAMGIKIK